jgi:hypothetical protein
MLNELVERTKGVFNGGGSSDILKEQETIYSESKVDAYRSVILNPFG